MDRRVFMTGVFAAPLAAIPVAAEAKSIGPRTVRIEIDASAVREQLMADLPRILKEAQDETMRRVRDQMARGWLR